MWLTPRVLFSKTKADMHLFPDTEVDEDIYLENTYLLTSLTSASYVG